MIDQTLANRDIFHSIILNIYCDQSDSRTPCHYRGLYSLATVVQGPQ